MACCVGGTACRSALKIGLRTQERGGGKRERDGRGRGRGGTGLRARREGRRTLSRASGSPEPCTSSCARTRRRTPREGPGSSDASRLARVPRAHNSLGKTCRLLSHTVRPLQLCPKTRLLQQPPMERGKVPRSSPSQGEAELPGKRPSTQHSGGSSMLPAATDSSHTGTRQQPAFSPRRGLAGRGLAPRPPLRWLSLPRSATRQLEECLPSVRSSTLCTLSTRLHRHLRGRGPVGRRGEDRKQQHPRQPSSRLCAALQHSWGCQSCLHDGAQRARTQPGQARRSLLNLHLPRSSPRPVANSQSHTSVSIHLC